MYYAVYEVATGALHSIELTNPVGLPPAFACVEVAEYADLAWNAQTVTFEVPAVTTARTISRKAFIERFTMTEWVTLVSTKGTDPVMAATFERLALLDDVDLDSAFVQAASAHAVAQGYMSQERMDEVLG